MATLRIDLEAWTVEVDSRHVRLSFREFQLLLFLAEHPGEVFRRSELIAAVWPADRAPSDRTVVLSIHRLRRKLGDYGRQSIRTVTRVGYRFDPRRAGTLIVKPAVVPRERRESAIRPSSGRSAHSEG